MLGSPFKTRSYYVFDYKPRYYDPKKERLEHMKKLAAEEKSASSLSGISISKDNLRKDWARHKKRTIDRKSNLRLAIIIAILVGFAAYFFEIHKLI